MFLRTTLVLFAFMHFASCSTISRTLNRTRRAYVEDKVQNYLARFGYLPQSDLETGNLRSEEQLRDAIRSLQEFGQIPVTGEVDVATEQLLLRRRCGVPDNRYPDEQRRRGKRYVLQGQTWQYVNLTWSLRIAPSSPKLERGAVRAELARALDVWAQHSKLTFTEIDSDRADILVQFQKQYHGDGYPFDGRGQVLAHAFFPGSGRGGDAHFDDDENWLLGDFDENEEGTSLFAVAVHEFGHSLGLAHSNVQGALMYPWYQGLPKNFELPMDDRYGIQQMYGTKDRLWGDIPSYNPAPRQPPTTTSTTTTTTTRSPWLQPRRPTLAPRTRHTRPTRPYKYPHYPNKPEYPVKPRYPDKPHYPEKPRYYPTRRTVLTRPTTTTERSRYPNVRGYVPEEPRDPSKPDTCDTSYDAISVIRGEVFIFKGAYFWRIGQEGLKPGYPAEIPRLWTGLPSNVTRIDAVYERMDRKIVFFIGKYYYVYGERVEPGYPRRLSSLGLPESLERIDAAMVWGYNSKTYLYSGDMYWRLDEDAGHVELDYPRDMSMWKGVGYNIDAVFQWTDGKTYFFKGKGFWRFNDLRMRVEHTHQQLSAPFWMGCPRSLGVDSSAGKRLRYTNAEHEGLYSSAKRISMYRVFLVILVTTNIIRIL